MDRREALVVLGIAEDVPWSEVRRAYRRGMRATHPDVSGHADAATSASRLTEAYATLRADWPGPLPIRPAPTPPPPGAPAEPEPEEEAVTVVGTDTIIIPAPPPEAFARLVDAAHSLGAVSYLDRSSGFLETVVTVVGGPACSLVVSVQGRGIGYTEAFVTVEPLGQGLRPPVEPFTTALAGFVAERWDARR